MASLNAQQVRETARKARVKLGWKVVRFAFNRRSLALALRREHVLCLGDSHVHVLSLVRIPGVWLRAFGIGGATASGILNPQSKTRSYAMFSARLARAPRWQHVLLQLGEVDCGFVIWHRSARHGLSIDEQLEITLDSYATFIERIVSEGFRSVTVLSAPLPTIGDPAQALGEVARLRSSITATQEERSRLTLRFNDEMAKRCAAVGARFVDVTTGHLDPKTGMVAERFLHHNPRNHHLATEPYRELVEAELRSVFS